MYLKKHFSFVGLREVINSKLKGQELPKNSVLLTFDDGLSVVYRIIRPILLKHKVPAAFFVNPNFVDNRDLHFQRKKNLVLHTVSKNIVEKNRKLWLPLFAKAGIGSSIFEEGVNKIDYKKSGILNDLLSVFKIDLPSYLKSQSIYLSKVQIEEMISDGFSFGGHSMDHPRYDELNLEEQVFQTVESIKWVKGRFKLDYSVFAFPLRDHNVAVEFFERIKENCDLSFGVMGMGDDIVYKHIQRVEVESTSVKISTSLKFDYIKLIIRRLLGKRYYKRPLDFEKQ